MTNVGTPAGRLRPLGQLVWRHAAMTAITIGCSGPVAWMIAASFARTGTSGGIGWPPSVGNYHTVAHTIPVAELLANTAAVAAATTVAQLVMCLLAAYALGRWDLPGGRLLTLLFAGTWVVPFQATMIPNYLLLAHLGLLNTLAGVVIPNVCSGFAVLMLRTHMLSFPRDLLDAAETEGAGSWATLWRVVVPALRPALASLAILLFVHAWNDYLWPSLVLQHAGSVIQLGIRSFLGPEGNDWGAVMAASSLACVPTFALYLLFRRRVTDAFTHSGLR